MHPEPRAPLADPTLTRPDWLGDRHRDPSKLWLDKNENTDPALAEVVAGLVRDLPKEAFRSYPELGDVYHKLADHLDCPPHQIVLAAGSEGAIRSTFDAYVNAGDTVLRTAPTYAMYAVYCRIYGAREAIVPYQPSDDGPRLDSEALIETIRRERPKLVCLPNPDSPTGTILGKKVLRRVADEALNAGSVMLIDEAYYPFYQETVLPWVAEYPNLIVTRTFDKAWGLAGFRIGCAVADEPVARYLHKVRSGYEIPAVAVWMLEHMLDHVPEVYRSAQRLEDGKAAFMSAMDRLGHRTYRSYGSFTHIGFDARAEKIHQALNEIVLYRRDFSDPCLSGFSRFSATTPELFASIIERVRSVHERDVA